MLKRTVLDLGVSVFRDFLQEHICYINLDVNLCECPGELDDKQEEEEERIWV
jgi:hypothetical protein